MNRGVAFRDLQIEILELFAETAPTRIGYGDHLRTSTELGKKHERSAAWNAAHPLKCRQASERYRAENREKIAQWKKNNREKSRAHQAKYRAKKKAALG